jgi:hypothetical protein
MATPRWAPRALPVAQVDSVTIANTWAAADTLSVTINSRSITLTVGATTTTASIAQALLEAINGSTITGDATRNETGPEIPEFEDLTATLFSASVVHVTGEEGVPFTMTATEVTAGTGTATRALVTAATGPWHFDNANNWDTGSVPVDGDTIYIDNTDGAILYGLDQSAVEPAAMYIAQSFTGTIGLPETNENDYHEYRSQYLTIGPLILQIGAGAGSGSGRIKINSGSDPVALTVFNSGSAVDDVPAILWKGTDATNALVQTGGDLGVAVYGAEAATLATINKSGGSLLCGAGVTLSGALTHAGGGLAVNSAIATSLTQTAGDTLIEGTGAVAQLTLQGGTCVYNTTGTLGGATVVAGDAILDFGQNPVAKTVTNPIDGFGAAARISDPLKVVASLIVDGNRGFDAGTQVAWGTNYRLTRAATA